ncbi:stage III sporulation protein AF [Virgibacillus siamensis]|uniref:Stage III sporulation protein AF n=1 Tax=Virgibacillus siamensis TaxID=480071 RepID=A0ABP3R325_9BACI
MEVLVDWVSKIIIFLLLASIIDLLIPATSMKKYIKLVVGLILILILLKPVFYLFDLNIQQAVMTTFQQIEMENTAADQVKNKMKTQKNEIQASQHAYVLEQMTSKLKKMADDPLKNDYQAQISDINYQFATEDELTFENLSEVVVYVRGAENEGITVDTVEDITINTDKPVINDTGKKLEGIKSLLYKVWEIPEEKLKLTVKWEGGST